jgi:hypothetical protein
MNSEDSLMQQYFVPEREYFEKTFELFDPNDIKPNKVSFLIGEKAVGKTTLTKYLISKRNDNVPIYCFSLDDCTAKYFNAIYVKPTRENLEKLINDQGTRVFENIRKDAITGTKANTDIIVIMEHVNCTKLFDSPEFLDLLTNNRVYDISLFIEVQWMSSNLNSKFSKYFDYVFIFSGVGGHFESIYNYFFNTGLFGGPSAFKKMLTKHLTHHDCIVFNNTKLVNCFSRYSVKPNEIDETNEINETNEPNKP